MSGNTEKALAIEKNLKYAKLSAQINQKLKLVKDKERAAVIKPTQEMIERKILELSRKDVEFYQETSMKILCQMVEQAQRTEAQMYEQLKGLIDEYKRQCVLEKENVEANYSVSLEKLGVLSANNNGRKRKLSVSNC